MNARHGTQSAAAPASMGVAGPMKGQQGMPTRQTAAMMWREVFQRLFGLCRM